MRFVILYLLLIPIMLLNVLLYPVDVLLVWVLLWLLTGNEKQAVYGAFLGGLLLDLGLYQPLGITSIALLVLCLLFSLYLRLHRVSKKITLPPLFVLLLIFYQWLTFFLQYHTINWSISLTRIALDFILMAPVFFIFVFFFAQREREPLALRY